MTKIALMTQGSGLRQGEKYMVQKILGAEFENQCGGLKGRDRSSEKWEEPVNALRRARVRKQENYIGRISEA
jgi:hypothetical protein